MIFLFLSFLFLFTPICFADGDWTQLEVYKTINIGSATKVLIVKPLVDKKVVDGDTILSAIKTGKTFIHFWDIKGDRQTLKLKVTSPTRKVKVRAVKVKTYRPFSLNYSFNFKGDNEGQIYFGEQYRLKGQTVIGRLGVNFKRQDGVLKNIIVDLTGTNFGDWRYLSNSSASKFCSKSLRAIKVTRLFDNSLNLGFFWDNDIQAQQIEYRHKDFLVGKITSFVNNFTQVSIKFLQKNLSATIDCAIHSNKKALSLTTQYRNNFINIGGDYEQTDDNFMALDKNYLAKQRARLFINLRPQQNFNIASTFNYDFLKKKSNFNTTSRFKLWDTNFSASLSGNFDDGFSKSVGVNKRFNKYLSGYGRYRVSKKTNVSTGFSWRVLKGLSLNMSTSYRDNFSYYTGLRYNFNLKPLFITAKVGFDYNSKNVFSALAKATYRPTKNFELALTGKQKGDSKEIYISGRYFFDNFFGGFTKSATVRGFVYHKTQDDKLIPLSNIEVVAGSRTVLTNERGYYKIKIQTDNAVVGINPQSLLRGFVNQTGTLTLPVKNQKQDFIITSPIILSGVVFYDKNKDGYNAGDEAVRGVRVALGQSTATSNMKGQFRFYDVKPGDYTLGVDIFSLPMPFLPVKRSYKITLTDGEKASINIPLKK